MGDVNVVVWPKLCPSGELSSQQIAPKGKNEGA